MAIYVLKRLGYIAAIVVLMSLLVFFVTHVLPANTAEVILGEYATAETKAALEQKLGLNLPLHVQYLRWAYGLLHGDFGQSVILEQPIAPILWTALARSALIAVPTLLIVALVGIGIGVASAVQYRRPLDRLASLGTYIAVSVPEFFWGLVFILVFSSYLNWLPTSGYGSPADSFWAKVSHLVLPVATLTLGLQAHVSRLMRSSTLEALGSNYVRAARARGMPERIVILRHAVRNAMLPTITVLAQDLGFLVGGIVAVETIFAYPGVGRLLVYAVSRHDLPLMEAVILVVTAIYCLANLAADLLYGAFNPRIRYGRSVD
ncbi:MAG TPA: ABC transporter permease [Stellaceae bacterium]|nr:ABC transporter permease [Stellaceae bacterium]